MIPVVCAVCGQIGEKETSDEAFELMEDHFKQKHHGWGTIEDTLTKRTKIIDVNGKVYESNA